MKNKYLLLLSFLFLSAGLMAQSTIKVAGTVLDESGKPLVGVSISVEGSAMGTMTDIDGKFRLENIPARAVLVYSFLGYETQKMQYNASRERERVGLKESINEMEEVVVTGRGSQRKVSVVGAITSIAAEDLRVPATSVSNMLGGRVPGIISVTRSGEPGNNFSEFWIRGISTFGASQSALVLIDGIEGSINDLDPDDIESFSILKDASATAVYGVRGANGVVVVTTKRGKAGKLRVNFKTNATYSYSPRMPEYAHSYDYARLANEAQVVRGNSPIYTDAELELFKTGLDPDLYPDVSWRDVILKDYVWNNQSHLSVSGGGENSRFYLSLGINNNEGIFKQDESVKKYSSNVSYNKYNFRGNIDANLTSTTELSLNLETVFVTQNAPGFGGMDPTNSNRNRALWNAQSNMPPTLVPVRYSNGQLPSYGTNADEMSPYVQLNYTGSFATERYSTKSNLGITQDLGMITEGLKLAALFSLSTNGYHTIARIMNPDLYYADTKTGRNLDGSLRTTRKVTRQDLTTSQASISDREIYFETTASYNRVFDSDHRVTGLVHFYLQGSKNSNWGNGVFSVIPRRYEALSGRATYSYKDTYLVEGNVGYTGSENFNEERRWGLFPSIALGWTPSQYQLVKDNLPFLNFFKVRASYGQVGNDRLKENGNDIRFPYLNIVGSSGSGTWGGTGLGETQIGAVDMEWETTTKYNLGLDAKLFNDRIDLVVDVFRNKTTGIFQRRANIPEEGGMTAMLPYTNIGSMTSWGTDGTLAYIQPIGEDMSFTVRGNYTLSRNKVDYWEQSGIVYPYQSYSGVPYGVMRGLIALGLFEDEDDVRSSPRQTFMNNVLPGDIKYKDVNGDGIVDQDDVVPLSYSNVPRVQYGFAGEFSYKNFKVSVLFEGVGEVQYFFGDSYDGQSSGASGGSGYFPYAWESRGNLLQIAVDQSSRWTPASYSGTRDTENPNARFPRLTYGDNANNNRASTFWLADGRYFRLKNVEVSYTLPTSWMRSIGIESATVSLVGDNLHVWDRIKLWDPAQASSNGGVYPLQRTFTAQLYVTF
ncbi:MAG: TonB-dependent receptor [Prevotellaceae bacterium]|jgi:TonB-linked SusC/RagA family outer membrane protein|nr:TonB-dependent receptor [Prevotellaceae bacterium]